MAHKKGQGSSKNGRDSNPQYRGIKLYGGQIAQPGNILVRQCGTKFQPGFGVQRGKDDTLFSVSTGTVVFQGRRVHIDPMEDDAPRPRWLTQYRAAQAAKAAG